MKLGHLLFNKILPNTIINFGVSKNSWNFKKINVLIQSIIMFPFKRIRGIRRTPSFVEKQYDDISGFYIQDNYYSEQFCNLALLLPF